MTITLQREEMMLTQNHFASMYHVMQQNQDFHNASKILDLYEKCKGNQFNICFAGHFSAGKSSIINYVLEKDVLPKSPIPTSANIVYITSGEGNAKVFFKNEAPVQYNEPYDIDVIKDYCMDKDTIKQINISTSERVLPANCILMDTPGIDAADDADRLMTESAVHVIDVLFYVMDYNHVQSEVNLYFLQEMKKRNLPIYIIINQVDKHNEAELSFNEYDKKVKQTFDQWNIIPEAVYYTSVIQPENRNNQLGQVKAQLFQMMENPHHDMAHLTHAFQTIVEDHQAFIKEQLEEEIFNTSMTPEDRDSIEALKKQLNEIENNKTNVQKEFLNEVQTTLKNAYIMPAKLRDLAGEFLKTQEKGFKVGIFQSKKKTNEMKEERLQTFLDALMNSIETNIQWKLREKAIEILQKYQITSESLLQQAQQLSISFQREDLFKHTKPGAMVNGNYILNYTNDLGNAIKNKYRQAANELWEIIFKEANEKWQHDTEEINAALEPYMEQQEQFLQNEQMEEETEEKQAAVQELYNYPEVSGKALDVLEHALALRFKVKVEQAPDKILPSANKMEKQVQEQLHTNKSYDSHAIIQAIDKVIHEIKDLHGFSSILEDLHDKKERLSNRELTIALFGTFSAGKSSFSNALFGERILPVSPNPTTAVISRISPVTAENDHGKVLISLKTEETLLHDLQTITKHLQTSAGTFEEWIAWIKKEGIYEHSQLAKTYQSYLEALIHGFDEQRKFLGDTIEVSLDEFAAFVTDETKACYIQAVDLYYDCSLTRKGVTIVDTPGADSVNARHTNVAFDYIKEADAILYVTYYNHAITSGDRDFLMQLGRVKDSFEMDKMFFIVNASDLAESEADLDLVVKYVTGQLLQFGIRNPKIYPVSSKLSLGEKIQHATLNDEMVHFEENFFSFIEKDLITLTVESSIWDMNRAKNTLQQFIHSSKMNENDKEVQMEKLAEQQDSCREMLQGFNTEVFQDRLTDRVDRQLHFVMDRLYIRFHDMFSEHFNSSTVNASGKKAVAQLEYSRNQFVDYVGYELLQEVRAVSLRMEAYMKELMKEAYDLLQHDSNQINEMFVFSSMKDMSLNTPKYIQAFEQLDMTIFQKALKIFKNTKSFYEQNERKKMEEAFYQIIHPYAHTYIDGVKDIMVAAYEEQWQVQVNDMKNKMQHDLDTLVQNHIQLLSTTVDIGMLEQKFNTLEKGVNISNGEQK